MLSRQAVRQIVIGAAMATVLCWPSAPPLAQTAQECAAMINLPGGNVAVQVPESYDPTAPMPLVIALHHYGGSPANVVEYMGLARQFEERAFLLAAPAASSLDSFGKLYWNATDACCDRDGTERDDARFLTSLVEAIEEQCAVDPRRIYFTGYSNGGFMSHRMGCELSERVAAIASLAGAPDNNALSSCELSAPVAVADFRGTADSAVPYLGGPSTYGGATIPGAERSAAMWAELNGCDLDAATIAPEQFDFDMFMPGAETVREQYQRGCSGGGSAELWSLQGSEHRAMLTNGAGGAFGEIMDRPTDFTDTVLEFLLSHRKPAACTESETVTKAKCRNGKLKIKLAGAEPGARYAVEIEDGPMLTQLTNRRGAGKAKFKGLDPGDYEVAVRFDCGAVERVEVSCRQ